MNAQSSRSHSILQIDVQQVCTETDVILHGKLFLIDLAGSETAKKTNAEGSTLKEAGEINKSLLELGNLINSLVDNHVRCYWQCYNGVGKLVIDNMGILIFDNWVILIFGNLYCGGLA